MRYAWIIDKDHGAEPGAAPGTYAGNAATVAGPHDAPANLLARLAAGEGTKFRLYDDDGELYYSGRLVLADPSQERLSRNGYADLPEEAFGPLWDFGTPNAGAVEIKFNIGRKWLSL